MGKNPCVFLFLVLLGAGAFLGSTSATALAPTNVVELQLHLRSATASERDVEAAFAERSTPGHPLFRRHLTVTELTELVGASEGALERATLFLMRRGALMVRHTETRDMVSGLIPITADLGALGLSTVHFQLDPARPDVSIVRRALPLSIVKGALEPSELMTILAVTRVRPARSGGRGAPAKGSAAGDSGGKLKFPGMTVTPQVIQKRYRVPATIVRAPSGLSQGVAEFQQSRFRQSDIATFSQRYGLVVPTIHVRGPNINGSADDIEGTLDLEYITAIAQGVETWWISQNQSNPNPGGLDFAWWCDEVLAIQPPPSVVSISWGLGTYNYAMDPQALEADNRAFRKLGLLGISVLAASGDSGPGARAYISCTKFMPGWPASSPYVTSVGATYAESPDAAETSVDFSGGGFSDNFVTPDWQQAAVAAYLAQPGLPASSFFNASGRGYPDVAALGTNFEIFSPSGPGQPSQWGEVSGTSCASPTFAAILTRINAVRRSKGQPALGFLNRAIYKLGKVGFDITAGRSVDTDCFGVLPIQGFPATKGWDAVSGLGTPDYEFLLQNL